jgi:hypothetical protein
VLQPPMHPKGGLEAEAMAARTTHTTPPSPVKAARSPQAVRVNTHWGSTVTEDAGGARAAHAPFDALWAAGMQLAPLEDAALSSPRYHHPRNAESHQHHQPFTSHSQSSAPREAILMSPPISPLKLWPKARHSTAWAEVAPPQPMLNMIAADDSVTTIQRLQAHPLYTQLLRAYFTKYQLSKPNVRAAHLPLDADSLSVHSVATFRRTRRCERAHEPLTRRVRGVSLTARAVIPGSRYILGAQQNLPGPPAVHPTDADTATHNHADARALLYPVLYRRFNLNPACADLPFCGRGGAQFITPAEDTPAATAARLAAQARVQAALQPPPRRHHGAAGATTAPPAARSRRGAAMHALTPAAAAMHALTASARGGGVGVGAPPGPAADEAELTTFLVRPQLPHPHPNSHCIRGLLLPGACSTHPLYRLVIQARTGL